MNLRFYIDVKSGIPHIEHHGVTEADVQAVIARPIEDRPGDRNSRILIGRGVGGRFLRVIAVYDNDGEGVFIITAYPVVGKALQALRRRMKRRGN